MPAPTVLDSDWYDQNETMQALSLKERTLRTWVRIGRVRTKTNPSNIRQRLYKAEDVEKLRAHGPERPERRNVTTAKSAMPAAPKPPSPESQAFLLLCTELREQRKAEAERREREREETFLTVREAAAHLRLPISYVQRAIEDGRLPAIKAVRWQIQFRELKKFRG